MAELERIIAEADNSTLTADNSSGGNTTCESTKETQDSCEMVVADAASKISLDHSKLETTAGALLTLAKDLQDVPLEGSPEFAELWRQLTS